MLLFVIISLAVTLCQSKSTRSPAAVERFQLSNHFMAHKQSVLVRQLQLEQQERSAFVPFQYIKLRGGASLSDLDSDDYDDDYDFDDDFDDVIDEGDFAEDNTLERIMENWKK